MRGGALGVLLAAAALSACSSANIAINRSFDSTRVQRVAVVNFADAPKSPGTGESLTAAFEQSLLAAGYDVVDRGTVAAAVGNRKGPLDAKTAQAVAKRLSVDALVMGQITAFSRARQTKVNVQVLENYDDPVYQTQVMHTVDQNGVPVDVVNKIVVGHRRGQRYRNEPRAYTQPGNLSVSARMVYPASGAVVWSGTDSTDAADSDAAPAIADDFLKAVKKTWPKK